MSDLYCFWCLQGENGWEKPAVTAYEGTAMCQSCAEGTYRSLKSRRLI